MYNYLLYHRTNQDSRVKPDKAKTNNHLTQLKPLKVQTYICKLKFFINKKILMMH